MTKFTNTIEMDGENIEVYDSAPAEGLYTAVPKDELAEFERNMATQSEENARLKAELAAANATDETPAGPRDVAAIEAELAALEESHANGEIDEAEYKAALQAAQGMDIAAPPQKPADPNAEKSPAEADAAMDAIYAKAREEDWPESRLSAALVDAGVIKPHGGGPAFVSSGIFGR